MNLSKQADAVGLANWFSWPSLPNWCIGGGGGLCMLGLALDLARQHDLRQFGYSWLLAFMFWLSIVLGA